MTRNWATDPRNKNSPNYNPEKAEKQKERLRSYDAAQRPKRPHHSVSQRSKTKTPFGTVDGEGGNIPDPNALFGDKHEYLMLRADSYVLNTGKPLTHRECFDFLASLPRNRIWTGFYFDYDVTMMCRSLPPGRAMRLFDPIERKSNIPTRSGAERPMWGVDIDDRWRVEYVPHKFFSVGFIEQARAHRQYTTVSDTSGFFQGSFVKTIKKWDIGTSEQQEQIIRGKALRADFHEMDDEIDSYNTLECELHNQLMEKVRDVCVDVGYVPTRWQGAGSLASAILAKHGVPKRDDIPAMSNQRFRALANAAYYGGRAETTAIGRIPGPVYQYDINGAYVAALTKLPCLIHGSWKHTKEKPAPGSLWVGEIWFGHAPSSTPERDGHPKLLFNLPVRKEDGNIFFPQKGVGYYWSWEVEVAHRYGTGYTFVQGWVYEKHCDCQPFSWIPEIYAARLRLGKSDKGTILKLGTNSIYGKIAQSIGDAPYANPVWAGLITAWCRAKIIEAYGGHSADCYMIMTDGIFMREPVPELEVASGLGLWDQKIHEEMFICQPGLYFLPNEYKTRGVPQSELVKLAPLFIENFDAWNNHQSDFPASVQVPVTNFITMRQALARRKWHLAGTWESTTKEIGFHWNTKRKFPFNVTDNLGVVRTIPQEGGRTKSIPYKKIIGGGQMESRFEKYDDPGLVEGENYKEQPDWVLPLLSGPGE